MVVRASLCLTLVLVLAPAARAEPTDRSREVHGGIIVGGGALYLLAEFAFKDHLASEQCKLCDPPAVDAAARRALKWDNTRAADVLSTVIGYAGTQVYALGMLVGATYDQHDRRRWIDDSLPVLESAVAVGLLHHVVKFTLGRQRPFVHHAPAGRPYDNDDNASLFSGHTGLAFAVATSAGVIAHERHYSTEPYIWTGGLLMAAATGYLRIAADRHWATDVTIGAVVGTGFGLLIPYAFHGDILHPDATAAPRSATPHVISLGGRF